MKDELKAKLLQELASYEAFQAQIALEDQIQESLQSRFLSIDTKHPNVDVEYAIIRGSLEALKALKTSRARLIELARSRNQNS
jgi:hypothetical protein